MSEQSLSSLSLKRIIISVLLMFMIPVSSHFLNIYLRQEYLSLACAMNIFCGILIIYDWNLFGIHYNRSKDNLFSTLIYTFIGAIGIYFWIWFCSEYMDVRLLIADETVFSSIPYAKPALLIAFSFMQSALFNIEFKCITDHIHLENHDLLMILLSGIITGIVFTAAFTSFDLMIWIPAFTYYAVLACIIALLYNMSHSFIPGILAMGIVYLIIML
ncbi:MAG: hypothetical protein IKG15_05580 [Solobacterium sp.]|nr:hypothetical protein [Solobacterium sp.]